MKKAKRTLAAMGVILWRHYRGKPHPRVPHHIRWLRMCAVGATLVCIGMTLAHLSSESHYASVRYIGEAFGWALHGAGSLPFVNLVAELCALE